MPWFFQKTTNSLLPLDYLYDNVQEIISAPGKANKELRKKLLGPDSNISQAPLQFHYLSLYASIAEFIPLHIFLKMPISDQAKWLAYQNIKNKDAIITRFNDEMDDRKQKAREELERKNKSKTIRNRPRAR